MGEAAEGLLDIDLRLRLNRVGRLSRRSRLNWLGRLRRDRRGRLGRLRLERYRPRRRECRCRRRR